MGGRGRRLGRGIGVFLLHSSSSSPSPPSHTSRGALRSVGHRVEGLWGPAERKAQSMKYQSSNQTRKIIAPTVRIGMPRSHELGR